MSLFSRVFRRRSSASSSPSEAKTVGNNGRDIRIPPPPPVSISRIFTRSEVEQDIGIAKVDHPFGQQIIYGVLKGFRDAVDRQYFAVKDSDIPNIARWAKRLEDSLTRQGYPYKSESGDCDDRADFAQACRRFYVNVGSTLYCLKLDTVNERPALGMAGTGNGHQILVVRGEAHYFWLIEPATGDYCKLEDYPNRHRIGRQRLH